MKLVALLLACAHIPTSADKLVSSSGDFLLHLNISQCTTADARSGKSTIEVVFDAASADIAAESTYVSFSLEPRTGAIELLRYRKGERTVLQMASTEAHDPTQPLIIELLRRGAFYMLYVGGSHLTNQPVAYVERPSSDVHCASGKQQNTVDPQLEPLSAFTGFQDVSGGVFMLNSLKVSEYQWESAPLPSAPVITHCPHCGSGCDPTSNRTKDCWAFNQVIPGALLRDAKGSHQAGGIAKGGGFVVYVAGQDWDGTDGGGKARIGVATGPALDNLTLQPEYILGGTLGTRDERSVFPNGALLLTNGTVAMSYMGQAHNDSWYCT
jgi:hypothetical protein